MIFDIIDLILRVILIGFFALFLFQSIFKYKKASEKDESQAKRFFLAYIIFYLISLTNFIHSEIQTQYLNIKGVSMYSPAEYIIQLGDSEFATPIHTIIFIGYLVPSIIPVVYIVEKELLKFKFQILTVIGIGMSILFFIVLIFPSIISFLFIPAILGLLILCFSFLSVYIKLALVSDGFVRKSALFSLLGWALLILGFIFVGLIFSSIEARAIIGILQHSVAIAGVIFIFYGSRILKR